MPGSSEKNDKFSKQNVWMVVSTAIVGSLPEGVIKRWIVKQAYVTAFRIMARSLSAVIKIHNKEYRPKTGGVCVANHTSPVDVVILSTDNNYSLVSRCTVQEIVSSWLVYPGCGLCSDGVSVSSRCVCSCWDFWAIAGDVVDVVYGPGGVHTGGSIQAEGQ